MPNTDMDFERTQTDVARLTAPDVLGFYTFFEATEIFVVHDSDRVPHNVFSLLVAEERTETAIGQPRYLGSRIRLKSLEGLAFGIKQCVRPIGELSTIFERFRETKEWRVSDQQLHVGALSPVPTQFVPPDSTTSAPWNHVLKNNFWNGSYVVELMDTTKSILQPLFDEPKRLQELSDAIQKQLPIRLASLSDRLGNVVVQLPITVQIATFAKNRLSGEAIVSIRWHPKAAPRPLRASCEMQFDNTITGYASASIQGPMNALPTVDGQGMQRSILWDDQYQVILAATEPTGFINTIGLNMHFSDPEPRVFTLKDQDGCEKQIRVGLSNATENTIGAPRRDRGEEWTRHRIYREEASQLAAQRRFVQYKPAAGHEGSVHEAALKDVRLLLSQYGKHGAWIWDPYLSADDVLRTLFYCPHKSAELRALTAGYERPPGSHAKPTLVSIRRQIGEWIRQNSFFHRPPEPTFAEKQRAVFVSAKSNLRSLRLEFRMRTGPSGWAFHDRFLIFPRAGSDRALAWSLGTSVNSLGRQHHILQQVDDAQLVEQAFEELWDQLNKPEHLVWKAP
jgi:hypothetical protein